MLGYRRICSRIAKADHIMPITQKPLGPSWLDQSRVHFSVWGPRAEKMDVHLLRDDRILPLQKDERGYFSGVAEDISANDTYFYRINNEKERPDPASRFQPEGVHGPSQIRNPHFSWDDAAFIPPTLRNTVFYELHVGTFTEGGTFAAIVPELKRLKQLGITALQIMPIAQFPGTRNWGYDGVQLYAPQSSYGRPEMLKMLVNEAHKLGLAVFLDVVYNHLGPEGNYLHDYGPYFTDRYQSPWSDSINFDGPHSDEVRRFFIENAIYWLDEFHMDGLRLDATHAMLDFTAVPFLQDLSTEVHNWAERNNRRVYLIGESEASDRKLVLPQRLGGTGLDGQWLDDLHHTIHTALTDEDRGYYADYIDFGLMLKVLQERFAYTGQYSPHLKRKHGTPAADIPADRYVVASQTHDQVGNRMKGERLLHLTDFESAKLAAGLLLTSPYTPMLFMGQEYGESAPFQFFTSFGDEHLVQAVREGRINEFASFKWEGEPPDPHSEETFMRSKLDPSQRKTGHHALLYHLYETLLDLRHTSPALTNPAPEATDLYSDVRRYIFCLERRGGGELLRLIFNWDLENTHLLELPDSVGAWEKVFDSNAARWREDGKDGQLATPTLTATRAAVTLASKSFAIYRLV